MANKRQGSRLQHFSENSLCLLRNIMEESPIYDMKKMVSALSSMISAFEIFQLHLQFIYFLKHEVIYVFRIDPFCEKTIFRKSTSCENIRQQQLKMVQSLCSKHWIKPSFHFWAHAYVAEKFKIKICKNAS